MFQLKRRYVRFAVVIGILGALGSIFKDDRQPLPQPERVMITEMIQENLGKIRRGNPDYASLKELGARIDSLEHHYKIKGLHGEEHIVFELTENMDRLYAQLDRLERMIPEFRRLYPLFSINDLSQIYVHDIKPQLIMGEHLSGTKLEVERDRLKMLMEAALVNIIESIDDMEREGKWGPGIQNISDIKVVKLQLNRLLSLIKQDGLFSVSIKPYKI